MVNEWKIILLQITLIETLQSLTFMRCFFRSRKVPVCMPNTSNETACLKLILHNCVKKVPSKKHCIYVVYSAFPLTKNMSVISMQALLSNRLNNKYIAYLYNLPIHSFYFPGIILFERELGYVVFQSTLVISHDCDKSRCLCRTGNSATHSK